MGGSEGEMVVMSCAQRGSAALHELMVLFIISMNAVLQASVI